MSIKVTHKDFLRRAKAIHGDKYTYIDKYINRETRIRIICPEHGEFQLAPSKHIFRKQGCPRCSQPAQHTVDTVIEAIKKKYGEQYDCSLIREWGQDKKITLRCTEHDLIFSKSYRLILKGRGCPKCGDELKRKKQSLSQADILRQFHEVHGNKYDYGKVEYVKKHSKVTIVCPIHGDFRMSPNNHIKGQECPHCKPGKFKGEKNPKWLGREKFIERAHIIHNNKYDYENVEYVNSTTHIEIQCPEHGPFSMIPNNHLRGKGCPRCAGRLVLNTQDFKKRGVEIHSDEYSYDKVEYVNSHTPVIITCKEHGDFLQAPNTHLSGSGCPKCSRPSKFEHFILSLLEAGSIEYEYQFRFPECSNARTLPFDFYLPSQRLVIEYHGLQHYLPQDYFGGFTKFREQTRNDQIKHNYLVANDYRFLVIPFWFRKEQVAKIIESKMFFPENRNREYLDFDEDVIREEVHAGGKMYCLDHILNHENIFRCSNRIISDEAVDSYLQGLDGGFSTF